MSDKCRGYEVAQIQAATATFVPLKTLAGIAKRHCPNNRVECVKAMLDALREARAQIDALSPGNLTPSPTHSKER